MKEGLEKDAKKVDSSGVKDVEISTDTGKKKIKEERPPTKVVVRRLPPTMTEEEFLQQIDPVPPVDYMYYVPADMSLSPNSFCRAYLNFINQSDIFIFTQKFDGYVFVDSKGLEYPAVVEFSPFQRIPKQRPGRKKDPKAGTLESDVTYKSFLEKLQAQIQESTTAGSNIKQHFFETNVTVNENKVSTTPLLDYLRSRHAERLRAREEKRKKDLERKRARDEQRRNAKKPEEDSSVVKPPVVSMKPKTEDERLLEQQTIFLRKLLGLPKPRNPAIRASCSEIIEGVSNKFMNSGPENVVKLVNRGNCVTPHPRNNYRFNGDGPFYSSYVTNFANASGKSKYSVTNRNGDTKYCSANGYWRREMLFNEGSKNRVLWKQPESRFENTVKPKMNGSVKSVSSKLKDIIHNEFEKHGSPSRVCGLSVDQLDKDEHKNYSLEKELLDESALEAFPTFEESKLHRLQKNFLKAIQSSPIKKESVEEIRMSFQKWGHDVSTRNSTTRKKELKKGDLTQVKIMKPPSRFVKSGLNRIIRENDESRLELIYESLLKDEMTDKKDTSKCSDFNEMYNNGENNVMCGGDGHEYFSDHVKDSVQDCPSNEVEQNHKTSHRFLIPKLKLPKAFGSGRKMFSSNFCLSPNSLAKHECTINKSLPKAFNSLLKTETKPNNCHLSHRNENSIATPNRSSASESILC